MILFWSMYIETTTDMIIMNSNNIISKLNVMAWQKLLPQSWICSARHMWAYSNWPCTDRRLYPFSVQRRTRLRTLLIHAKNNGEFRFHFRDGKTSCQRYQTIRYTNQQLISPIRFACTCTVAYSAWRSSNIYYVWDL